MRPGSGRGDIEAVLAHWSAEYGRGEAEFLGGAGGYSGARLWRLETPLGPFLLRRWPAEHPDVERLALIHAIVAHAARRGVWFLAPPILTRGGQTFVRHGGHLWEVSRWLSGTPDHAHPTSPVRLRAAMEALAQFHRAGADFPGAGHLAVAPSLVERSAKFEWLRRGGWDEIRQGVSCRQQGRLAELAGEAVERLALVWPVVGELLVPLAGAALRLGPALRDVWRDHVLFVGDEVTGIVDYGAARIDWQVIDVVRLLGSLAGDDRESWEVGLEAYERVRSLADEERRAVAVADASGVVLACVHWLEWVFVERRSFEKDAGVLEMFSAALARLRHLAKGTGPHGLKPLDPEGGIFVP